MKEQDSKELDSKEPEQDFETDRGSGTIIAAFAVLALVAIAALYRLYPVDQDANGKDIPQARINQTAPDSGTTGISR